MIWTARAVQGCLIVIHPIPIPMRVLMMLLKILILAWAAVLAF